ncbi:hypothetical protein [Geodermatophilus sp. SYSU D00815]
MLTRTSGRSDAPRPRSPGDRRRGAPLHVHWFRWSGDDAFGPSSLYACRCGAVRPGL